jgi:hypothetical protein
MKADFATLQNEYLKNIQDLDNGIGGKTVIESFLVKLIDDYIKSKEVLTLQQLESAELETYQYYNLFYDHNIKKIEKYLKTLNSCFKRIQSQTSNENRSKLISFVSQLTDFEIAFYYYYIFFFDRSEHKAESWIVESKIFEREDFKKRLKHPSHIIFYKRYVQTKTNN